MLSGLSDWVTDVIDTARLRRRRPARRPGEPVPADPVGDRPAVRRLRRPRRRGHAAGHDRRRHDRLAASGRGALRHRGVDRPGAPATASSCATASGCGSTPDDIDRAERWFDRRAGRRRAGRPVRAADPLAGVDPGRVPADAVRPRSRCTRRSARLIWNSALIGAGYILRDNWEDVEPVLDVVQYVVIAVIVVAIGWFIWTRRRSAPRPLTDRWRRLGARSVQRRRATTPPPPTTSRRDP